jgi:hypothetical protein
MLELTADWVASGSPERPGAFPPPAAYASSAAFDRDEDAEMLAALSLLLAVAHPARLAATPATMDEYDDNDCRYGYAGYADWGDEDDPWGRYCTECGANSHYECDCPCPVCGQDGGHDCPG